MSAHYRYRAEHTAAPGLWQVLKTTFNIDMDDVNAQINDARTQLLQAGRYAGRPLALLLLAWAPQSLHAQTSCTPHGMLLQQVPSGSLCPQPRPPPSPRPQEVSSRFDLKPLLQEQVDTAVAISHTIQDTHIPGLLDMVSYTPVHAGEAGRLQQCRGGECVVGAMHLCQ